MSIIEAIFLIVCVVGTAVFVLRANINNKKKNAHLGADGVAGADILEPILSGFKVYDVQPNEKLLIVQTIRVGNEQVLVDNNSADSTFRVDGNKVVWSDNKKNIRCSVLVVRT